MSKRKINLEEILSKEFEGLHLLSTTNSREVTLKAIKDAMKEACKQVLELAAENVETIETSIEDWKEIDYESDFNYIPLMNEWEEIEGLNKIIINKQSILDTIKQIE